MIRSERSTQTLALTVLHHHLRRRLRTLLQRCRDLSTTNREIQRSAPANAPESSAVAACVGACLVRSPTLGAAVVAWGRLKGRGSFDLGNLRRTRRCVGSLVEKSTPSSGILVYRHSSWSACLTGTRVNGGVLSSGVTFLMCKHCGGH
jgi:hypothetical protein